jgi:hypothetical protein
MSMVPASRVTLKEGLSDAQVKDTLGRIEEITGRFNLRAAGNPPSLIVNMVSATGPQAAKIRALPAVASVRHQF